MRLSLMYYLDASFIQIDSFRKLFSREYIRILGTVECLFQSVELRLCKRCPMSPLVDGQFVRRGGDVLSFSLHGATFNEDKIKSASELVNCSGHSLKS